MKERRITGRIACTVSLTYKLLTEKEFQGLSEILSQKRLKIVTFDKLVHENKKVDFKLHTLEDSLEPILTEFNEQLRLLIEVLSMDTDVASNLVSKDVVINLAGARFKVDETLNVGEVMELQIRLETGAPRILLMGEVLRSQFSQELKNTFVTIVFSYIEPEDKLILQNFVNEHR